MNDPERATARRVVLPGRCNPGRDLYRRITRKRGGVQVETLSDFELLRVVLPETAARAVCDQLEARGGLSAFHTLGDGGPHALLGVPGVDEATAARLLVLWEVAARVTERFRAAG